MVLLYDSGLDLVQFVGHDVPFCDELGCLYLNDSIVDKLLILKWRKLQNRLANSVIGHIKVHQVTFRRPEPDFFKLLLQLLLFNMR